MWAEFQHSTVRSACTTTECCKRHPKACRRSWESATASLAGEHLDADAHAHTHVTYVAFSGRDDVVREVGRSAFSLLRASRSARVHVLTDDSRMKKALLAAGLPSQATVQDVARSLVLAREDVPLADGVGAVRAAHVHPRDKLSAQRVPLRAWGRAEGRR